MSTIHAHQLGKSYGRGSAVVHALADASFTIDSGAFVGIMGESGSGKSTLLSILGAMNTPTTGTLTVDGIDVYDLKSEQRADFRREFLGFVFQSFHLIPYLSLLENVMLPLTTIRMPTSEKRRKARAALDRVGLGGKGGRLPGEASGGEKERCAIARAIVNDPPVLLADEPTGNLDTRTTDAVMDLFTGLNAEGMTIVMVTHSPRCAGHVNRILTVADGRLAERQ
jgi:putative ABC transport system ATP-binding protein